LAGVTFFETAGRDACAERRADYSGLDSGPGRYADPVPDGAQCLSDAGEGRGYRPRGNQNGLVNTFVWVVNGLPLRSRARTRLTA
jgi:hypothetical protein